MATVKIKFNKCAQSLWNYIYKTRENDDPMSFHNCTENFVADKFLITQDLHGKRNKNEVIHIIQSWNEEESKMNRPEKLNQMGMDMCQRLYPGYDAAVVTHTETGKTHNHIMLNPVQSESGERILSKKKHLYLLRHENDKLARENHLSVIVEQSREHWDKMSDTVRGIQNRTGFSRRSDLLEKLKFASSIATSFDEYSAYLNKCFDIKVKIRGQTISYVYPGMERGRKAKKLGARYDFDMLVEKFKSNDWKLYQNGQRELKLINTKNYTDYHKFSRYEKRFIVPGNKIKNALLKPEDIEFVRQKQIGEFCKTVGVRTVNESDGCERISGREYVKFIGSKWENEKNRTQGGTIEFAANFRKTDFMSAISELSGNTHYSDLAKILGVPTPSFKAYYVPDNKEQLESRRAVESLSKSEDYCRKLVARFANSGQLRVYDNKRFKAYPFKHQKRSITYYKNKNGTWFSRLAGGMNDDFLSKASRKNDLVIFDSVHTFLRSKHMDRLLNKPELPFNIIVPLSPVRQWINEKDDFLSSFQKIRIVRGSDKSVLDDILTFTDKRKSKGSHFLSVKEIDKLIQQEFLRRNR